jgi:hypothetical protein
MLFYTLFLACGSPAHLQHDHGRAFHAAFDVQADRARASAQGATYPISGAEAEALRLNVEKATTDEAEDGSAASGRGK